MARGVGGAWWTAAFVSVLSVTASAGAEPLPSNDYAIDLFQGPILAPIRVTGIAGAYAGYAEGIEGMVVNAAAPAVREPWSAKWVELDIGGSVSIPLSIFENNDFDNSNTIDSDYSNFIYLTGGAIVQVGVFGVGANVEFQRYTISGPNESTHVTVGKYHLLGAARLLGDQLMVGAGPRIVTLGLDAPEANLTIAGLAPELGFLLRPDWRSVRIGATYRFPVDAGELIGDVRSVDAQGRERAGGLILPQRVVLPWELEIGVAVQVGPRPLNPAWIDPHDQEEALARQREHRRRARAESRAQQLEQADPKERSKLARQLDAEEVRLEQEEETRMRAAVERLTRERRARYWNWPRQHLLFTAEVLVSGPVEGGVTLGSFLGQSEPSAACNELPAEERPRCERDRPPLPGSSGGEVNYSPRFGIETEPVLSLIKTRFGSYYEPNRLSDDRVGRQHFTFGADLRMFSTTWFGLTPEVVYKLQASVDIAPRYESFSFGMGVWR